MQQQTFTDFEKFRATHCHLDGEWLINGGKDRCWSTEYLAVGASQMMRCYSKTGLICEGVAAPDAYQFYVPFRGAWRNNGISFNKDEILVMEPGAEQCETTAVAEGWHLVVVPRHVLEPTDEATYTPACRSYTIRTDADRTRAVRQLFANYIAAVVDNPEIEFSPAARMMEAELHSLLAPAFPGIQDPEPGSAQLSRINTIHCAHAVMEEFAEEPIHVSQLASMIHVSIRTLQVAFNDQYGVGPKQYLRLRQLHRVRRDLLCADPDEINVTDILMRWGVWEFGRFAGRYKLQFGELPRDTLQRRRRSPDLPKQ